MLHISPTINSAQTSGDFDVGYVQGTTVVRIRTSEDLEESWSLLRQPRKNMILWCNGLITHAGHKHKHSDEDNYDTEQQQSRRSRSKKHDTNVQQVQDKVDHLKAKYGSSYTQMQFCMMSTLNFFLITPFRSSQVKRSC